MPIGPSALAAIVATAATAAASPAVIDQRTADDATTSRRVTPRATRTCRSSDSRRDWRAIAWPTRKAPASADPIAIPTAVRDSYPVAWRLVSRSWGSTAGPAKKKRPGRRASRSAVNSSGVPLSRNTPMVFECRSTSSPWARDHADAAWNIGFPEPSCESDRSGSISPAVRTMPTTVEANGTARSASPLTQTRSPTSMPSAPADPSLISNSSGASASARRPATTTGSPSHVGTSTPSTCSIVDDPERSAGLGAEAHHGPRRTARPREPAASPEPSPARPTGRRRGRSPSAPASSARRLRGRTRPTGRAHRRRRRTDRRQRRCGGRPPTSPSARRQRGRRARPRRTWQPGVAARARPSASAPPRCPSIVIVP